jgi:hypothetical protein
VELVKQSFLDPWPSEWKGAFDLVHQRFALAGAGQVPLSKVIENCASLCKPGGWIELVELNVKTSLPGTGPANDTLIRLMREIFSAVGVGGDFAFRLKSLLEGAGLERVEERRVQFQVGAKAKPDLVQKSINGVCKSVVPLTAAARCKFTWNVEDKPCDGRLTHSLAVTPTSFTAEELDSLESRVREELETQGSTYEFVVAYGRKPEAE